MTLSLNNLNTSAQETFLAAIGHVFEHSPWIAHRAFARRPFASIAALHEAMVEVVRAATGAEKLALIRAHPDLVGKMARDGALTRESTSEQAAAGLAGLSPREVELFDGYNADYRARFGFPFVICARENKKAAILAAFPRRLKNSREQEVDTALAEIFKIVRLRLDDAIRED